MALYYDLPVYKDTYKLIIKIFYYAKDFSREYKYTLMCRYENIVHKKQAELSFLMDSIGKQITGWRNANLV